MKVREAYIFNGRDPMIVEAAIKKALIYHNINGEWFDFSDQVLEILYKEIEIWKGEYDAFAVDHSRLVNQTKE